jgi:hypothetical protein
MTGCPYGLIYSASHTFDALRRAKRIAYHSGLLALQVSEERDRAVVKAKELATGRMHIFEADRLYVACGAIGTTRLVLNSLGLFNQEVTLQESAQFTLPVIARSATTDPRAEPHFTLNQFNMVVALDERGVDVSQLHFYTYNPAFIDALPNLLRAPVMQPVTAQLLRRLFVALGYLPSWTSPRLKLRARAPGVDGDLPEIRLSREDPRWHRNAVLRQVLTRVIRSARFLDMWPIIPKMMLPAGGKSYHLGSSFPHGAPKDTPFSSDSLGRVGPWQRTHLVDASVFPNVPATTFTLTIMANAHRIATETLRLQP